MMNRRGDASPGDCEIGNEEEEKTHGHERTKRDCGTAEILGAFDMEDGLCGKNQNLGIRGWRECMPPNSPLPPNKEAGR